LQTQTARRRTMPQSSFRRPDYFCCCPDIREPYLRQLQKSPDKSFSRSLGIRRATLRRDSKPATDANIRGAVAPPVAPPPCLFLPPCLSPSYVRPFRRASWPR